MQSVLTPEGEKEHYSGKGLTLSHCDKTDLV